MWRYVLVGLMAVTGCVTVNKTVLMDRSASPVPKEEVYIFLPGDLIPNNCQRVAILNAKGAEGFTDQSQMYDKLREEAGKLGANAIIMLAMMEPTAADRSVAAYTGTLATRDGESLAIWCPVG